jgi:hypothetical protein
LRTDCWWIMFWLLVFMSAIISAIFYADMVHAHLGV